MRNRLSLTTHMEGGGFSNQIAQMLSLAVAKKASGAAAVAGGDSNSEATLIFQSLEWVKSSSRFEFLIL